MRYDSTENSVLTSRYRGLALAGFRQSLRVVPDQHFGSMLRARRFADNITQAELGSRLGVRQQTVGAWERGERPQARFLPLLADYVGLNGVDELKALLDDEVSIRRSGGPSGIAGGRSPHLDEPGREALAALVQSYARRIEQGDELSATELAILRRAVEALDHRISAD
jgi:transcriptional regulator with XRE-family HTH domain